jgi:ABC-2 type transport system ATP-binding protein
MARRVRSAERTDRSAAAVSMLDVTRRFGATLALDGVHFEAAGGEIHGLLGAPGAGKTTLVRILATLIRADAGTARVAGFDVARDPRRVRRRISLTGQYAAVDGAQTGRENLWMMGRLAGLSRRDAGARAAEMLERFDLTDAGGRTVATYSGGMRRRLDLAVSLTGRPSVVFLDEPTTGLDPTSRQAMWQIVLSLAGSGVAVLLTTQYLDEADRIADRIAVLNHGRIIADGSATELKRQVSQQRLDLTAADVPAYERLNHLLGSRVRYRDPLRGVLGVPTDGSAAQIRALLDECDPNRVAISSFAVHTATLDDVFHALTGDPAREKETIRG